MNFDQWYQEQIAQGNLKHPTSDTYKNLRWAWLVCERTGKEPTTANICNVIFGVSAINYRESMNVLAGAFDRLTSATRDLASAMALIK